jgi:glycosyltransferase involved in cell wall biosynthesis
VNQPTNHLIGFVAIGRNEGDRLKRCLQSLPRVATLVYVDSGSVDGSDKWARDFGAEVVDLGPEAPFTAARARNAGIRRLLQIQPGISFIQFIDGDCEIVPEWLATARQFLQEQSSVAAVFGRRRERYPDRSIYNQLCDWEWDGPSGEARAFGGDVMIRVSALKAVGGYRDSLIAGEEPELSVRLRSAGWLIFRLDAEMSLHDAAITKFDQWWKRMARSGYAFAQGAHLHGRLPERHWVWESRRTWFWGFWLPLLCVAAGLTIVPWGWASFAAYPVQIVRQSLRVSGSFRDRITKATFQLLSRFPEAAGQLRFWRDHLLGRESALIEYK